MARRNRMRLLASKTANGTNKKVDSSTDTAHHEEEEGPLFKFLEGTSIHGLDQIYINKECWAKTFWVLVLTTVVVIVIFQVKTLIQYYISSPRVTSITVQHPEHGIPFPAITICVMSKINATAAFTKYPKMDKRLAEFASTSFISPSSTALYDGGYFTGQASTGLLVSGQNLTETAHQNLTEHLQSAMNGDTVAEFLERTSFNCEGQFQYCWLENGAVFDCCTGVMQENQNDTLVPVRKLTMTQFLTHSGACYEFAPTDFTQRVPGPVGGLGFVYIYPNEHLLKSAYNSHGGYAVHLYASPADAMLERNPTKLPVGYHSNVNLEVTKTKHVDLNLVGQDTCQDPKLKYFASYSYSNCQAECMVDTSLRYCNCTGLATVGRMPRSQTCTPAEAISCYKKLVLANQPHKLARCRFENCRESCEYWMYNPTLTVSKVFNPVLEKLQLEYWRLPESKLSNQSTSSALIIGEIYFGDIKYTEIEEKAALTLESFVSNIGGAMGLWTGASIISWIHLTYFIVATFCIRRRRRSKMTRVLQRMRDGAEEQTERVGLASAPQTDHQVTWATPNNANGALPTKDTRLGNQ